MKSTAPDGTESTTSEPTRFAGGLMTAGVATDGLSASREPAIALRATAPPMASTTTAMAMTLATSPRLCDCVARVRERLLDDSCETSFERC